MAAFLAIYPASPYPDITSGGRSVGDPTPSSRAQRGTLLAALGDRVKKVPRCARDDGAWEPTACPPARLPAGLGPRPVAEAPFRSIRGRYDHHIHRLGELLGRPAAGTGHGLYHLHHHRVA